MIPLHLKSDVHKRMDGFRRFVVNHFGTTIKTVRSDYGGEFLNRLMNTMFQEFGIVQQTTCPYTPQQNGVVERKHAHIIETIITLLQQSLIPVKFWLEAMNTSMFLINRLPHSSINFDTLYEKLYKYRFNYNQLKVFGCSCFPYIRQYNDNKLQLGQSYVSSLDIPQELKGTDVMIL